MYVVEDGDDEAFRIPLDWAYPNTAKKFWCRRIPLPNVNEDGDFII